MTDDRLDEITPKEMNFLRALAKTGSQKQALVMAGYSDDSKTAHRILGRTRVQIVLTRLRTEALEETKLDHVQLIELHKKLLEEAREAKQYNAVARIAELITRLSGYGKLLAERVELEVEGKIDLTSVLERANRRIDSIKAECYVVGELEDMRVPDAESLLE